MTRVAITRAAPEAHRTADRVRRLGATPVIASLFTIEPISFDPDIKGAQALFFTSTNGARAFAEASSERAIKVLTVGDATAEVARTAGFADVTSADGDVTALTTLAKQKLDPSAGPVLHISGERVAGDLIGALAAAGFTAERRFAYIARAAEKLPDAFAEPLDIVLFHSPRAADLFTKLGAPNANALVAGCLSQAVAHAVGKTAWRDIIVSPAPREDLLLKAVLGA